jgi:hypothetical protein
MVTEGHQFTRTTLLTIPLAAAAVYQGHVLGQFIPLQLAGVLVYMMLLLIIVSRDTQLAEEELAGLEILSHLAQVLVHRL